MLLCIFYHTHKATEADKKFLLNFENELTFSDAMTQIKNLLSERQQKYFMTLADNGRHRM